MTAVTRNRVAVPSIHSMPLPETYDLFADPDPPFEDSLPDARELESKKEEAKS